MNNYEFIDIKYIYLFFLIFIFFIYGLTLSEIIDFIFPEYDKESDEYRIEDGEFIPDEEMIPPNGF